MKYDVKFHLNLDDEAVGKKRSGSKGNEGGGPECPSVMALRSKRFRRSNLIKIFKLKFGDKHVLHEVTMQETSYCNLQRETSFYSHIPVLLINI